MSEDRVVELLQGIWGEMKSVNGRIEGTNARLDATRLELSRRLEETNQRLEETRAEVSQRIAETNRRLNEGFSRMDLRFEHLLLGEHGREHRVIRDRLARLEAVNDLPPHGVE